MLHKNSFGFCIHLLDMADPDVPWEIEDPSEEQPAEEEAPPAEGESAAGPPAEGAEGKPAEGEQPSEELPPPPSVNEKFCYLFFTRFIILCYSQFVIL